MWRRPVYQTLSKALDISSAKSWVFPDLLKALAILSDTTARRSAVDREDLKPYWKSQKRPKFSRWPKILLFASFSKTLLSKERRLTGQLFLAVDLFFPNILKYRDHQWKLPKIWKTRLLQTFVKFQFSPTVLQNHHRNTVRTFDKSRFVMTFLTKWELQKYYAVSN